MNEMTTIVVFHPGFCKNVRFRKGCYPYTLTYEKKKKALYTGYTKIDLCITRADRIQYITVTVVEVEMIPPLLPSLLNICFCIVVTKKEYIFCFPSFLDYCIHKISTYSVEGILWKTHRDISPVDFLA